jgi:ABC-type microcin C transport system permease subunit YejB
MDPQGFGLSNGVITILALLAGFTAANTDKISIICALVSLLITDPLSDSYSIYVASDEENRFEIFTQTWIYQVVVQAIFLLIVIFTPKKYMFKLSCLIGLIIIGFDFFSRITNIIDIFKQLAIMIIIIVFTYYIESVIVTKKYLLK